MMVSLKGKQFLLLLWKNYVIQKRRIYLTILEIALPAIFCVILITLRGAVEAKFEQNGHNWSEFSVNQLPPTLSQYFIPQPKLAYCPCNDITKRLLQKVGQRINIDVDGYGFPDEETMTSYILLMNGTYNHPREFLGGISFTAGFPITENSTSFEKIAYKIRLSYLPRNKTYSFKTRIMNMLFGDSWNTDSMFPMLQTLKPRDKFDKYGGTPGYYWEGFLSLQYHLDRAIWEELANETFSSFYKDDPLSEIPDIAVTLRRHPFPPYNDDPFIVVIQTQFPMLLMVSFVLCALTIAKDVVHEKERKLKESLKMMGVNNWLHWLAWYIKYLLFMLITVLTMTLLLCISLGSEGPVLGNTNPIIVFLFLMTYAMVTIAFSFMISVFFSKANFAAAAAGVLFFVSYIPYMFIQYRYETMGFGSKMAWCLIFNVAMSMGGQLIGMFQGTGAGLQWSNLAQPVSVDDELTVLYIMLMMLLDSVIYLLIAFYIEAVFPGDYGVPQPWYFPVTKTYWCGSIQSNMDDSETIPLLSNSSRQNAEFFEKEPIGIMPGIKIYNMRKEFGRGAKQKVAVAGMTLSMYEGQITALLGHNGAGKTTTMSMLTGFIPPTAGTAKVNGYDIRKDISSVRQSLGLCPQHDILFDTLTVSEHLWFFARLKGCSGAQAKVDVTSTLNSIGLMHKKDSKSQNLSGGMKRKLSVGMALIGDSKVVILDEPSSGMDPSARRQIWNVLQRNRAGRTMVLTTHCMDEADLLGDRIAIMSEGEVQCCGSSLFLKNKYGAGYHMVIVKEAGCDVDVITELIMSYVPLAKLENNIGFELSYILPHESSEKFEALFTEIQQNQKELGISSYGASVTTMEEVFLRVGESTDDTLIGKLQTNCSAVTYSSCDIADVNSTGIQEENDGVAALYTRNSGYILCCQQFYAMFLKRVLHTMRNLLVTSCQLAVPVFFAILAVTVLKTMPEDRVSPPLVLEVNDYGTTYVPYARQAETGDIAQTLAYLYPQQFNSTEGKPLNINTISGFENASDVQDYLFDKAKRSVTRFDNNYIIAAAFLKNSTETSVNAKAYFNGQAYHSSALTLSVLANTILQYFTNTSIAIETTNHPLPPSTSDKLSSEMTFSTAGFFVSFSLVFGMSFLASSFVIFLIKERSNKAKLIQFASGVSTLNFWTATFVWDLINFLIPCITLIIVFVAFTIDAYIVDGHWLHLLLLFILYAWSILPLMYVMSFLFSVPSSGFVGLSMLNLISGMLPILAVYILEIPSLNLTNVADGLKWAFMSFIPNYCLGQALSDYYNNYEYIDACTSPIVQLICLFNITFPCCPLSCGDRCITYNENYLGWESYGIGRFLVFLTIQGTVFFLMLFIIESSMLRELWYKIRPQSRPGALVRQSSRGAYEFKEDTDVAQERARIANTSMENLLQSDALVLQELTKYYQTHLAVSNISVGISNGECFGLLGVNGAGKTTTFKMLTGDETLSRGTAILDGYDVRTDIKMIQQRLGYCPQFDALIDEMTGREMLVMFARLRGVQQAQISNAVQRLIDALLLSKYADKMVKTYSGGNKRKLSTAIALVGHPPIILLDEPTTGMDPVARRLVWDTLSQLRDAGATLILTSHSMEECEALCTRLAIMVNGQFKCLGSPQHLKSRFGEGYTLIVKVNYPNNGHEPDVQPLMRFIEEKFPDSILKDIHEGMVLYHIMGTSLTWAQIFGTMERAKAEFNIEDYSVSQTTLDQVFINFVRSQLPPSEWQSNMYTQCKRLWGLCCCCCYCCKPADSYMALDTNERV